MSGRDESGSATAADHIEWFDDVPGGSPPKAVRSPSRRRRSVGALLGVAVVVLVVGIRARADNPTATAKPSATPAAPSPAPTARSSDSVPEGRLGAQPSRSVTVLARPVLDNAPAGWDLFGQGPTAVVRIQLGLGIVTVTSTPAPNDSDALSFLVGPGEAIIRPLDGYSGFGVSDQAGVISLPAALDGDLDGGGPALPGPDAGQVWVPDTAGTAVASTTIMRLFGFDGTPTATTVALPADIGFPTSDGDGYLRFSATGGVYDARPAGITRVTTGAVLAVGPAAWLTDECDAHYTCALTVIDRTTGTDRRLSTPDTYEAGNGVTAPDGRTAALLSSDSNGRATVHLLDLLTGADRSTGISVTQVGVSSAGSFVWSPDGRELFVVDSAGVPLVYDVASGHTSGIGLAVPPLDQIALRGSSA